MTEQFILEARQRLAEGDEKGALDRLESARNAAKKQNDVQGLAALVVAGEEIAGQFTGRQARAYKRFLDAAKQNQAFAERKAALAGSSPDKLLHQGAAEEAREVRSPASPEMADDVAVLRPDVEAAKARMRSTFGSRRELKKLDEYLWHDETVSRMASGALNGKLGLLIFTDRRLIFLFHGWVSQRNEDFPLDAITSISVKAGMAMATITVYSGGAKHEISSVPKDDAKAITNEIRNHIAVRGGTAAIPQPAAPEAPMSAATAPQQQGDVLSQLKQLGELRDAGVLTNEEFEAKKAELLTRL
jgi:hypothetical protein